jgi:hypothetical protein
MNLHNEILVKEQGQETATKRFKTVTKNAEEKLGFRLFFIGNEDYDVEVVEVDEIDFADVKRRLEGGESIFMSGIQRLEKKPKLFGLAQYEELWYFSHI